MAGPVLPMASVLGRLLTSIVFTCVWSDVSFTYSNDHRCDHTNYKILVSATLSSCYVSIHTKTVHGSKFTEMANIRVAAFDI